MPPVAQTTHYLKPTPPEEAAQAVRAASPTLHSPVGAQALISPAPSCSPTPSSSLSTREPFEGLHGHTLRASPQARHPKAGSECWSEESVRIKET